MKEKKAIVFILLVLGCGAIALTLVMKYAGKDGKEVRQEERTQPRISTQKVSKEREKNRSAAPSAHVLSYGELYAKVIDRSRDTLTVMRIEPTTSEPIGREMYIVRPDKETTFVYQKSHTQNGKTVFTPEKGSLDTIRKEWHIKLRYDPEQFFPAGIDYGNREGFIIPQEIMFSEPSPFQP